MIAQAAAFLIGCWLLAAPDVLGYAGAPLVNDRIVGPIAASIAFIAMAEVTRALRWANVPLAVWLVISPLVLGYPWPAALSTLASGAAIGALSLIEGRLDHDYAGGWMVLARKPKRG